MNNVFFVLTLFIATMFIIFWLDPFLNKKKQLKIQEYYKNSKDLLRFFPAENKELFEMDLNDNFHRRSWKFEIKNKKIIKIILICPTSDGIMYETIAEV